MRCLALLLMLIGLTQPAFGQVVKIVKPECGPLKCRFYLATGVIIGREPTPDRQFNQYWILTVHHVSGDRWDAKVKQHFRRNVDYNLFVVAGGTRFPASIVNSNGDLFLMLLTCKIPAHVPAMAVMPIATVDPQAGQAVAIHGHSYKRNGEYGQRSVTIRAYGPTQFEITSPFEEGESGGPVVHNGQIVGLSEGYHVRTKIGFGPSLGAIRGFLSLSLTGAGQGGGIDRQAEVSVPSRVPVSGGSVVSVPPPPAPEDQPIGNSPRYSPPLHNPGEITPAPMPVDRPRAEPDPISRPVDDIDPEPIPAKPRGGAGEPANELGTPIASGGSAPENPVDAPSVGERVANAANTGLTLWNFLAGVGVVTGIGGPIGLGMFALGKIVAARRRRSVSPQPNPPYQDDQPLPRHPPIARPVPLAPQEANFIPIPTDYRREAVDWAMAQHGQRYPGAIPSIEAIKSLINQRLQSRGHGRETLHD